MKLPKAWQHKVIQILHYQKCRTFEQVVNL